MQWYAKQIRGLQKRNLRKFCERGLTLEEIRFEIGVNEKVIAHRLKLYGLKRKKWGVNNF